MSVVKLKSLSDVLNSSASTSIDKSLRINLRKNSILIGRLISLEGSPDSSSTGSSFIPEVLASFSKFQTPFSWIRLFWENIFRFR